jgi:hypothetical protein
MVHTWHDISYGENAPAVLNCVIEIPEGQTMTVNGQQAAGDWTLFIADLSAGDTATLDSWMLSFVLLLRPKS